MAINQAMDTEINPETVAGLFRERRFEEAANLAEVVLRSGSGVARILALRPPFGDAGQLKASEVFFRGVAETLETGVSVENLADVWNANGKVAAASSLPRRCYDRSRPIRRNETVPARHWQCCTASLETTTL